MQKILIKNWIYILDMYRFGMCVYRKNINTFREHTPNASSQMDYSNKMVARANLMQEKKVRFTLVEHRLPFRASVYLCTTGASCI